MIQAEKAGAETEIEREPAGDFPVVLDIRLHNYIAVVVDALAAVLGVNRGRGGESAGLSVVNSMQRTAEEQKVGEDITAGVDICAAQIEGALNVTGIGANGGIDFVALGEDSQGPKLKSVIA